MEFSQTQVHFTAASEHETSLQLQTIDGFSVVDNITSNESAKFLCSYVPAESNRCKTFENRKLYEVQSNTDSLYCRKKPISSSIFGK